MRNASRQYAWKGSDYLVIGCQKCGTTSLYRYMIEHLGVLPARDKQLHYFDRHYVPTLEGYAEQFPELSSDSGALPGEAPPVLKRETAKSKAALESAVGGPVRFFSYPDGTHGKPARKGVADAGYEAAFSVAVEDAEAESLATPRFSFGRLRHRWNGGGA